MLYFSPQAGGLVYVRGPALPEHSFPRLLQKAPCVAWLDALQQISSGLTPETNSVRHLTIAVFSVALEMKPSLIKYWQPVLLMNITYLMLNFSCSKIILHLKEVRRTRDSSFSEGSEVLYDMWGKEE